MLDYYILNVANIKEIVRRMEFFCCFIYIFVFEVRCCVYVKGLEMNEFKTN